MHLSNVVNPASLKRHFWLYKDTYDYIYKYMKKNVTIRFIIMSLMLLDCMMYRLKVTYFTKDAIYKTIVIVLLKLLLYSFTNSICSEQDNNI